MLDLKSANERLNSREYGLPQAPSNRPNGELSLKPSFSSHVNFYAGWWQPGDGTVYTFIVMDTENGYVLTVLTGMFGQTVSAVFMEETAEEIEAGAATVRSQAYGAKVFRTLASMLFCDDVIPWGVD